MISIFNGRERTLGGSQSEIYAQINVDFREYLYLLKGARLGVFLAIALHANSRGWAWPSRTRLARETGYNPDTVSKALADLCQLKINDQRLLLKYQKHDGDTGTFKSNRYLIFPSEDEVARYEHAHAPLPQEEMSPCSGFPLTVEPCTVEPVTVQPVTENLGTKKNHAKEEPWGEGETEETEEEPAAAGLPDHVMCSIHHVPMPRRTKDGDVWYSHKLDNGLWCRGAPGDQPARCQDDSLRQSANSRRRYAQWADPKRYISGEFAEFIEH